MQATYAMEKTLRYVTHHYMEKISTDDLEYASGVSRFALARRFHKRFGVPPLRWVWMFRLAVAARLLVVRQSLSCGDVALACGFETPAHFCRMFRASWGLSPGRYRQLRLQLVRPSDSLPDVFQLNQNNVTDYF
jgi:transcriptional regulator GlxA family with amidase domain